VTPVKSGDDHLAIVLGDREGSKWDDQAGPVMLVAMRWRKGNWTYCSQIHKDFIAKNTPTF
jgi:hypothetical protein